MEDGFCTECGIEFTDSKIDMSSSYSEYHSYVDGNSPLPFEADLKNLSIPEEVKNTVISLASSCPRETHRMGVRRQQLFAYIYIAYLQLGYKFDPDKIKEKLNMNQREVNMALRIISGTSSLNIPVSGSADLAPLSAPIVVISPLIYLEDICKNNNIEESYEEIQKISKVILEKNKLLLEYNPKHIAVAMVRYYLNLNKINIPKFAKLNGISDSILKQHLNRIISMNL